MPSPATFFLSNLKSARRGWRDDPAEMAVKALLALVIGQTFWRLGYDQLGLFMNPRRQIGPGQALAAAVYRRLPPSPRTAWVIKALEITCDLSKLPIEGRLYRRRGFVCDVVATLVTQPLWSGVEAAEKLLGVIIHPERVATPEQVRVSLGCIYGTAVRYTADLLIWRYGDRLYLVCRRHLPL
jgi:hypothetical protein